MNNSCDINSSKTLIATIFMGVVGPEVFIVQPGFVQGLVEYLGFTEKEAGYIASIEVWGIAVTTILMTFISQHVNWRHFITASLIVIIVSNLLSLLTKDIYLFSASRFLVGLGCGGLVSLSFTIIGLTNNPERNFAYYIMWVLIYGAVGLFLMPLAFDKTGIEGVIFFFALFPVIGLLLVGYLPKSCQEHLQVDKGAIDLPTHYKILALAAMFSYFIAQGVIWAYLFLIGLNGGGTEQQVANGLTLSQFFGLAGALLAAMLGIRFGRVIPVSLGIILSFIPLAFLFGKMGILVYSVAVCVYNFAWNAVHPFLLAAMASFDRQGKTVIKAVALQMLGLAIGPAIAATVLSENNFSHVLYLGIFLFLLSWVFILPPLLKQKSLSHTL